MKKIFSLVVLFASVLMANAQSSLVATLHHDGSVKTFYTASALRDAHAAAVHGDVITLSSGTFTSVDITKAITLRGAGMELDTITNTEPTVIAGDFTIQIADDVSQRLTIEGIFHNHLIHVKNNLVNATFQKNRLLDFGADYNGVAMKNIQFLNCRIVGYFQLPENSSTLCLNSMINHPFSVNENTSNFEFHNCFIRLNPNSTIYSSTFKNCIFEVYQAMSIHGSCMAYNCVATHGIFSDIPNSTNHIDVLWNIFKTYRGGELKDSENFELKEEAQSKYLGDDGTQVGIYGGFLPYEPFSNKLRITRCNVANKSTADGKLSVDIEVKSAE